MSIPGTIGTGTHDGVDPQQALVMNSSSSLMGLHSCPNPTMHSGDLLFFKDIRNSCSCTAQAFRYSSWLLELMFANMC